MGVVCKTELLIPGIMKKINCLLYSILLVSVTSCEKFIEETPRGSLIPKSVDDMGMVLANDGEINVGIGNTLLFSNDVIGVESLLLGYTQADLNAIKFADYLYGANENDIDWNRQYHAISLCNFVADNIDEAPNGIDGLYKRKEVKGSALFHRAYAYFLLVNEYARHYNPATASVDKGIPLLLHLDVNHVSTRATVQQVYDQIINDATAARDLLPDTATVSFNASKAAANALLATAYLYQGKFTESWKAAAQVTAVKKLKDYNTVSRLVATDPRNGFNNLDGLEWKREEVLYYRQNWGMLRNFLFLTSELVNLYDKTNDLRYHLFLTTRILNMQSAWGMDRHSGLSVGEIYLTEAEARVRDNNVPVADVLTVLNKFMRTRYKTGYPDMVETDRALLKARILDERRKEIAYRGMRLFDIKRLAIQDNLQVSLVNKLGAETFTVNAGGNKMILPIPLNVISKTNMDQNPR
jgi:hypothetical protein